VCSNGNWATKYVEFHTEDFSISLMKQLQFGHITLKKALTIFVAFRSTTQHVYVDEQLITSYTAPDLMPTIQFSNDNGPVIYSNFTYVPR
jgi:hypothetical protein